MYVIPYTLQPSQEPSDNNDSITIKAGRSSQHSRVLVVDDEPDITEAFKIGLEENGFEVDVFNDPLQALSKFEENISSPHYYDLLLLDVKMPKMNGFELYREIKRKIRKEEVDDDDRDKLKVCFITAYEVYYESLKEEFPALNVGCFLKKPIEIQELVKRIRSELKMA
jgi:DNA-binding response OmpR family regulator